MIWEALSPLFIIYAAAQTVWGLSAQEAEHKQSQFNI